MGVARLLLDTHAFIWAVNEPEKLGDKARAALVNPLTEVYVSAASIWEIATKGRLGKLPGADILLASFSTQMDRLQASELSINVKHAALAGSLDWEHRDPFDRMILAQSLLEDLTLVTADTAIAGFPSASVLWD